jgi:RNA polymerase sigma factor (sigma-70 family)
MSEFFCPDCNKGFPTMKACSGHMAQCRIRHRDRHSATITPVGLRRAKKSTAPIVADGHDPRPLIADPLATRLGIGPVRLAARSEYQRLANDAYDIVLSFDQEQIAWRAMRRAWLIGDSAEVAEWEAFLTRCNIRLVLKIALGYEGRTCTHSDLIQFGAIGLVMAIRRFDPDRGFRFSTMATNWIRQQIGRGIHNDDRIIRLPVHIQDQIQARLKGREAKRVSHQAGRARVSELWTNDAHSLDKPLDEDGSTLGRMVAAESTLELEAERSIIRQQVASALATLDERSRQVLILRFGLGGDAPMTLDAIGEMFGLSKERIRQIQRDAFAVMREQLAHLADGVQLLDAIGGDETDEELAYAAD